MPTRTRASRPRSPRARRPRPPRRGSKDRRRGPGRSARRGPRAGARTRICRQADRLRSLLTPIGRRCEKNRQSTGHESYSRFWYTALATFTSSLGSLPRYSHLPACPVTALETGWI
ncbi:hypothetical protein AN913_11145 [Mycobacteroides immunogenum]|uniref:Uncharacterized protein n=1 Tax=Mycobacteroides immunogenum TaxID=83262 RepID=A0ABR5LXL5_9MYCO|nr:hypothetical protein AN913_11145 [Mycobacteroides immunogenum]KPG36768.1 hypothetical protein AN912_04050 [Mycobacteroides immunogenum]KPG62617.1 hypothetical protein AN918_01230 [Mycobacteroides immunogenum]